MFSVLVIRLRCLRLLRVGGFVSRRRVKFLCRMFSVLVSRLRSLRLLRVSFFFQAEDGIRDWSVTGVQTCALPISPRGDTGGAPGASHLFYTSHVSSPCQTRVKLNRSEERRVGKECRSRW